MTENGESQHALEKRVVELELALTHLQRDFETLNETILLQNAKLEDLTRKLEQLDARVDLAGQPDEQREPGEERPPHY